MANQSSDICQIEVPVDPGLATGADFGSWMIRPNEVGAIQEDACAGLEPAFERSDTDTASAWVLRCQHDLAQLWHCGELWAVTQVVRGKPGLILLFIGMAGRFDQALLDAIESWGRSIGCVRVYFTGRRGWLRREPDYRMSSVTGCKDL